MNRPVYHQHANTVPCSQVPGPIRNFFGHRTHKFRCPVCGATRNMVAAQAVCTGKVIKRRKRA